MVVLQVAVNQLMADVAGLAAPSSLFYFDFLHLDVLEGRSQAVGYANTAKVCSPIRIHNLLGLYR